MKAAPSTSPVPPWLAPPETPVLGPDEVHVWRATLDQTPSQIRSFRHNLAADERARAERFHFERDRGHFIVARGVLRAILGGYLNRAPECLSFCYSSYGKPALAGESGGDAIRFNVSHSHGIALYAVTRGREVGVDLERIRSNLAVAEIAERFFSRREVAALRSLSTEEQREVFFRCWTRKEACFKARGEGLSLPLDQMDVSLTPGEPGAVPGGQPDSSEASRWSLQELAPAPGYVAALAVEGQGWRLACWQWPDPGRPSV
ncbi:MAG TPA: 4'-phosphopantetheinyl transferase superfamily protein [Verrucomicrobiae bacterium]|nr:4'-phosphopantetheinyl transferase superfamily protein [Verrucomicrobiae bacterium]